MRGETGQKVSFQRVKTRFYALFQSHTLFLTIADEYHAWRACWREYCQIVFWGVCSKYVPLSRGWSVSEGTHVSMVASERDVQRAQFRVMVGWVRDCERVSLGTIASDVYVVSIAGDGWRWLVMLQRVLTMKGASSLGETRLRLGSQHASWLQRTALTCSKRDYTRLGPAVRREKEGGSKWEGESGDLGSKSSTGLGYMSEYSVAKVIGRGWKQDATVRSDCYIDAQYTTARQ